MSRGSGSQGREYSRVLHEVQDNVTNVTPELLAKLQAEAEKQRCWVAQSEWIESVVRACDWSQPFRSRNHATLMSVQHS